MAVELASSEAENCLLGCLITSRLAPANAMSMGLTRDDYAWEVNSLIHDAVVRIVDRGHAVDETVLTQELASAGHLELIGGEAIVRSLATSPHDDGMLAEYVNIIRDRAMRRNVLKGFEGSAQILYTEPDGKKAVEQVQERMYRAFDKYLASAFNGMSSADLRNAWELRNGVEDYILFPYETMNFYSVGRERGTLNIWGAYSSDGKSVVGVEALISAARQGKKVAMFCLEMTSEQMTIRLLARMSGVSATKLNENDLSLEDLALIETAFAEMDQWDFTIYCDPSITVQDMRATQLRERYDHIIVDYLQRFDFADFHEIPRFAKALKNIALSTKCSIDLLSQLTPKSIQAGQNPFTKPDNMSLYGGKATANEADNVFFIWAERTPDEHGAWQRTGRGWLINTKARQGRTEWEIPMVFDGDHLMWMEN